MLAKLTMGATMPFQICPVDALLCGTGPHLGTTAARVHCSSQVPPQVACMRPSDTWPSMALSMARA